MKGIEQLYALKALACEHLREGRYAQAAVYLKDVLERFQNEVGHINNEEDMERAIRQVQLASRKNLSLCCLKQGKYQGCIQQCRLVLEVEPNNIKVVFRIGRAYLQLRQFDSAEHYLRRAFYLDPQEREVMRALEEIEHLRQEAKREEQARKAKHSVTGLIKWIIALIWSLFLLPLRVARTLFAPAAQTAPKRE